MPTHQLARIARLARPNSPSLLQARTFSQVSKRLEAPRTEYKPATASTPQSPRRNSNNLPVFPIVFIFVFGSASFYLLARSRASSGQKNFIVPEKTPEDGKWPRKTASDQTLSRR